MPFGWQLLRPGTTRTAVLAVDFTQARVRAEAGFGDLAAHLPAAFTLWGTEASAWQTPDLAAWLDMAGGDFGGSSARVHAVLGFCAGAGPAAALAARLPGAQLVVYDPTPVTAQSLVRQYRTALAAVAPGVPAGEVTGDDPVRLVEALSARYAALAEPACAALGVPAPIAEQLTGRFTAHLRYLAAAAQAPGLPSSALVVLSAGHPVPDGHDGPVLRLDVAATELLRERRAAAVLDAVPS